MGDRPLRYQRSYKLKTADNLDEEKSDSMSNDCKLSGVQLSKSVQEIKQKMKHQKENSTNKIIKKNVLKK